MKATRETILAFIRRYTEEHGFAPSTREIARGVGLRSTSAVAASLDVLEANGLITRDNHVARSIRVLTPR